MNPAASLTDLVDSLELQCDDFRVYFDRQAGKIVSVEQAVLSAVEEGEEDELLDWQQDEVEIARAITEDKNDRFIEPPDQFEFDEYRQLQRFINTVHDERMATELTRAIRGKGAFGRFKDTVYSFGIQDNWFEFRTKAMKEFVIAWADLNNVSFVDDFNRDHYRGD